MDEVVVRLVVVGSVMLAALAVAWWLRRPPEHSVRRVSVTGMDPGIYLFTSGSCSTCVEARNQLDARLGSDGYTEVSWERSPSVFSSLGVDAVPAVLLVEDRRRGRLYSGLPDDVLTWLDSRGV